MPNLSKLLDEEEVQRYKRDGFLVPRFSLGQADIEKLQQLTARLLANNSHVTEDTFGSPHVLDGGGPQQLKTEAGWLEMAMHPEILDVLEQLMGPDIILWTTTVWYKRPETGPATPWHRDADFYPIQPMSTTTVWIAVYESVRENACLRCIPGSHLQPTLGKGTALTAADFDENAAVDVALNPGQMIIFDVFTLHGSWPNVGDRPRAGLALRFFPSTSHYDHFAPGDHYGVTGGIRDRELILVRGRDRGNNRFGRVAEPGASTA